MELTGLIPGDHNRLAADIGRQIVIVVRQLTFMRQVDPISLEDVFDLQFEDVGVSERLPTTPVDPVLGVLLHGGVNLRFDLIQCDRHTRSSLRESQTKINSAASWLACRLLETSEANPRWKHCVRRGPDPDTGRPDVAASTSGVLS